MANNESQNPFAPPVARVAEPQALEGEQVLAGRGARLGAAFIDGLIAMALSMAILLPMYGMNFFLLARYGMMQFLPGIAIYYVLFLALQGWFLYQTSQTIGKKLVGLRIVRNDGSHATVGRLVGARTLLIYVITQVPFVGKLFGLIDCLFIFGEQRRCLHDLIADTKVVTAESSESATLAGASGANLRSANF